MCIANEMNGVNPHPLTPKPSSKEKGEGIVLAEMSNNHFGGD